MAASLAVLYLWVPSVFPTFVSPNELSRVLLTRAIVDDGTLAIDRGVERAGVTWSDLAFFDGHYYSDKAPGLSFAAVPIYALCAPFGAAGWSDARAIYASRLGTVTLPALLFLLWRLRRARGVAEAALWCAVGTGTMFYTQALSFTAHLPAALLALVVLERVLAGARGARVEALHGALLGAAVALDYLAAIPVAVVVLVALVRRAPARVWLARAAGFAPPVLLLLGYHWLCFGGPFELAYEHMVVAKDQLNRARGFFGATLPDGRVLLALLFGAERGLFVHSPILLGAVAAAAAALRARGERLAAAAALATFGSVLLFNAALGDWQGGWSTGPRYLTLALPLLAWALARWAGHLAARLAFWAALAAGWGTLLHVAAIATFPLAPFGGPLRFPALELAAFLLGHGFVSWNPAFLAGFGGVATLLPLAAALAALAWAVLDRRRRAAFVFGAIALWAVAAALARDRTIEEKRLLATFPQRVGYSLVTVPAPPDR